MKISGTAIAIAFYLFAAWRTSGLSGLVASAVLVLLVAVAREGEKEISRDMAFWLDLIYWSILIVPFFIK
ncbi:MAG: hypothetical protein II649_06985 [Kiritimatiellae bacterium]|nr:hypothetical protein [Kiritimatiellia bacterium]